MTFISSAIRERNARLMIHALNKGKDGLGETGDHKFNANTGLVTNLKTGETNFLRTLQSNMEFKTQAMSFTQKTKSGPAPATPTRNFPTF